MIGFAAEGDRAVVQIFPLRGGKMVDRHSFHLENVGGQDLTTVLESFCLEYYGSAPSVPPQIIVPRDAGDLSALAEFLSEKRGARVEVRTAERGEKRRLQQLADENARHALVDGAGGDRAEARAARRGARGAARGAQPRVAADPHRVLRHLARDGPGPGRLDGRLPGRDAEEVRLPQVRDQDGGRRPGRLRRDGGGDLAPLRAALRRDGETHDASFATAPNLVVIDGGKGQLSAALAAMQAYDLPRVAVIALAKRIEEVFVPGPSDPIVLSRHNPGLQLLQRIRDEAHRFALGFHRQRRESRGFASIFDDLEGVGPARRRALLSTSARSTRCSPRPRRSSRACPACRRRRRADLRAAAQDRPRLEVSSASGIPAAAAAAEVATAAAAAAAIAAPADPVAAGARVGVPPPPTPESSSPSSRPGRKPPK